MPGFIGVPELLLLGIVALLVFGPKKLPELGRSLGSGMREFKDSVTGSHDKADQSDAAPTSVATIAPTVSRPTERVDVGVVEPAETTHTRS